MVKIGEHYRHFKSTWGSDHTYEIVNNGIFKGEQPEDMSEVAVCVPREDADSSTGVIVISTKENVSATLKEWDTFDRHDASYILSSRGVFQLGSFHDDEEVIIYKPLYPIADFPP